MSTWYIIDNNTNEIVNAREGNIHTEADALRGFSHPERLRADRNPPMALLQRYRYWNERP